jgi:hypothetical protein
MKTEKTQNLNVHTAGTSWLIIVARAEGILASARVTRNEYCAFRASSVAQIKLSKVLTHKAEFQKGF